MSGPVQLVLTEDESMRNLNASYKGKDRTTDVLSFDLGIPPADLPDLAEVGGEIYISLEQARLQAAEQNVPLIEELARLLVHGLLHLAGYDHDTPESLCFMERATDGFLREVDLLPTSRL